MKKRLKLRATAHIRFKDLMVVHRVLWLMNYDMSVLNNAYRKIKKLAKRYNFEYNEDDLF